MGQSQADKLQEIQDNLDKAFKAFENNFTTLKDIKNFANETEDYGVLVTLAKLLQLRSRLVQIEQEAMAIRNMLGDAELSSYDFLLPKLSEMELVDASKSVDGRIQYLIQKKSAEIKEEFLEKMKSYQKDKNKKLGV